MSKNVLRAFRSVSIAALPGPLYAARGPGRQSRLACFCAAFRRVLAIAGLLVPFSVSADSADGPVAPPVQVLNGGQVVLEGAPPLPPGLAAELGRFQQARYNQFAGWAGDSGIYIKTRSDGVSQLYTVARANGPRSRISHTSEAIGEVETQPGGSLVAFTMSENGDGFDQIYLLDPHGGSNHRLTDGNSLNNRVIWDRTGRRLAWRSTRRDGRHSDIWLMDVSDPASARLVLEAPDSALWKPVAFDRGGSHLLVQQFSGITDSAIYVLRLTDGQLQRLAGDPNAPASHIATGFSADGNGVHFITNQRDGAAELGWVPLEGDGPVTFVPGNLPWDVTEFEMSMDGQRGAFVTNEGGISRLYLFDPEAQRYRRVKRTPMGSISGIRFSADGRRLGMTISTAQTPSDAFVLDLGRSPLRHGKLERWTFGEVGGLDTRTLPDPELVHFPAPMITDERVLAMPAFYYRPAGVRPPYPVVILIHGGPEGQFRPIFDSTIQMWLDTLGVAVIAPNVRGSLGYGSAYLAMDDGRKREHAVQDIGALLDWIDSRPDLDGTRVAVFGASYGGYMALASAVHYSDRLRAAVDRAGISHFVTYLENTQDYRRALRRAEYGDERDPDMRAFLESISPLTNAGRITVPLLIAQGQNDPVVPESESRQMVDAVRQQGGTAWYMNALNEGHQYLRKENRDLFEQVSVLFLRRYLLEED